MSASENQKFTRREFAAHLAAGAAPIAGCALPRLVMADEKVGEQPAQPAREPDKSSLVDRLLEIVRQRYPDARLDAAALAEIRGELEDQIERSQRLSAFPLANGDEPGFVFRAYRRD